MEWSVAEAKTKFSLLLNTADTEGVQVVTKYGKPAGFILSPDDYALLTGELDFKEHLASAKLHELDLERSAEGARDLLWQ